MLDSEAELVDSGCSSRNNEPKQTLVLSLKGPGPNRIYQQFHRPGIERSQSREPVPYVLQEADKDLNAGMRRVLVEPSSVSDRIQMVSHQLFIHWKDTQLQYTAFPAELNLQIIALEYEYYLGRTGRIGDNLGGGA